MLLEYARLTGFRDAEALNTILQTLEDDTTAGTIDGDNFREEGLDIGAVAVGSYQVRRRAFVAIVSDNTPRVWTATTATVGGLVLGAATFQSPGFTIAADETLLLESSVFFDLTPGGTPGIPADSAALIQLRYQPSAGAPTVIPGTTRRKGTDADGVHACMTTFGQLDGPLTLDWVELQVWEQRGPGNSLYMSNTAMHGAIYHRV